MDAPRAHPLDLKLRRPSRSISPASRRRYSRRRESKTSSLPKVEPKPTNPFLEEALSKYEGRKLPEPPKEEEKKSGIYSDTDTLELSQVSSSNNNSTERSSSSENLSKPDRARSSPQKVRVQTEADAPTSSSDDSGIWINLNRGKNKKALTEQRRGSKVSDILDLSDSSDDRKNPVGADLWQRAKNSYARVNKNSKQSEKPEKKENNNSKPGDTASQNTEPSKPAQQQQQQRKSTKQNEQKTKGVDQPLSSIPEEGVPPADADDEKEDTP